MRAKKTGRPPKINALHLVGHGTCAPGKNSGLGPGVAEKARVERESQLTLIVKCRRGKGGVQGWPERTRSALWRARREGRELPKSDPP